MRATRKILKATRGVSGRGVRVEGHEERGERVEGDEAHVQGDEHVG